MGAIRVVLATDENYAQHTGIVLLSLLCTKASPTPVAVYVIDDGLSQVSRSHLRDIASRNSASLEFLSITSDALNHLPVRRHLSRTAYHRLDIANLLPPDAHKALYLDSDTIILSDVTQLWDTDIAGCHLAAVEDYGLLRKQDRRDYVASIGIPKGEPYFNSGVLLINLDRWREDDIGRRAAQRIAESTFYHHDQDGLNAILWGKWLPVHPRWNVHRAMFQDYYHLGRLREVPPQIAEAVRAPCVAHFTGRCKPWHFSCAVPCAAEYYRYLRLTPWMDYRPPDVSLSSLGQRLEWIVKRGIVGLVRECRSRGAVKTHS